MNGGETLALMLLSALSGIAIGCLCCREWVRAWREEAEESFRRGYEAGHGHGEEEP